jgi:hypothetical protein
LLEGKEILKLFVLRGTVRTAQNRKTPNNLHCPCQVRFLEVLGQIVFIKTWLAFCNILLVVESSAVFVCEDTLVWAGKLEN